MIKLFHLTKQYGSIRAVDDLSLSVPAGQIFGFIGPNGAGKTTTIRMMGGIIEPTIGRVVIDGIDMARHPEAAKRKIGFIPDRPYLYEKISALEFMQFSADIYGVNARCFQDLAEEKLRLFSLADWSHELIEAFSHGMKQRLIMAAALLHEPEIIIVDEPMVGLDPLGIKMVKNLFKKLASGGVTVFMSTHTLPIAQDICDRIGIIHRGSLLATGTVEEIKHKAHLDQADLEDAFISLTRNGESAPS